MFKVGETVIDNDKHSFYNGREIVITGHSFFSKCVVYSVVYKGNIHYALREDKIKERG